MELTVKCLMPFPKYVIISYRRNHSIPCKIRAKRHLARNDWMEGSFAVLSAAHILENAEPSTTIQSKTSLEKPKLELGVK